MCQAAFELAAEVAAVFELCKAARPASRSPQKSQTVFGELCGAIELARVVFEETEGNPFFVEEVFRHLSEEGKLFDETGKLLAEHKKSGGEDINYHHTNLHKHLRDGQPLTCPVELGMAGVVAVNMANESWRSGRMMGWDAAKACMVPADTLDLPHTPDENPPGLNMN